jgi:hypothetical protein
MFGHMEPVDEKFIEIKGPEREVYFGEWAYENWNGVKGREAVAANFNETLPDDVEILFAIYTNEGYSGDATVIFRQGGKLYLVEGGHCSCYGLEGQWEPTETNVQALRMMPWSELRTDEKASLDQLLEEKHEDPAA